MKYARFMITPETIGIGTITGVNEKGEKEHFVGGYLFLNGIGTITDEVFDLAPANACIVMKHHRARLVERNF